MCLDFGTRIGLYIWSNLHSSGLMFKTPKVSSVRTVLNIENMTIIDIYIYNTSCPCMSETTYLILFYGSNSKILWNY